MKLYHLSPAAWPLRSTYGGPCCRTLGVGGAPKRGWPRYHKLGCRGPSLYPVPSAAAEGELLHSLFLHGAPQYHL